MVRVVIEGFSGWAGGLSRIGLEPSDSHAERARKGALTLSAVTISLLAFVWVGTYAALGLWLTAAAPLAYQLVTLASILTFARTKNFAVFRAIQLTAILLLPFLLQWSLGGFVQSSAVMLWALMAPLGALLLHPHRAVFWFASYVVLTLASAVIEPVLPDRSDSIPNVLNIAFFVLNLGCASGVAYAQVRYFTRAREQALAALEEEHRLLELEREKSKLAALGTMAAGLMHELNNPVAAVVRGAAGLREGLTTSRKSRVRLHEVSLVKLQGSLDQNVMPPSDPLDRAEKQDELAGWLEGHQVDEPWELAPTFVDAGWTVASLERFTTGVLENDIGSLMQWTAATIANEELVNELQQGARRISELVDVAKRFTYVDQAVNQQVDVHSGLEDALVILSNKIGNDVHVIRDFAGGLPEIEAQGAALNQVWANLIDNALAAMSAGGDLTLRTRADGENINVEIRDSGEGIEPELIGRVFDPFFTTKAPGSGAGLGLSTVQSIVASHGGTVAVSSKPGQTSFQVSLPLFDN